ncbi:MAG: hypothetical protein M3O35_10550 [Acidobacteriota bacterium]|nr:hypothetical protein [Acidobacteriota bacterium]
MKLARYWIRGQGEATGADGQRVRVVARGWSDESMDAARERAREIAQRTARAVADHPDQRNRYEYGDRPLPEPVVREFGPSAVVTRNGYGALVLNTDHLMFVDVDREDARLSDAVMRKIESVAQRHDFSARVYKTAGGYRVLIGNVSLQAGTSDTEALLTEFGSDPLYMRLCRLQESFRARLTPKPYRLEFPNPPVEFPFETPQQEGEYRRWEQKYEAKAAGYSTCRYLTTFGGVRIAPEFEDLVYFHDQETKAASELPLA